MPRSLILASTSKYRRALLARLQIPFTTEDPLLDEAAFHVHAASPRQMAETLASEKARRVLARHREAIVIGSDQVACVGGKILGKPGDAVTALSQLKSLTGCEHELITAVTVIDRDRVTAHTEITRLRMGTHSEETLKRYLALDQPFDCAGSYKIEQLGISLFTSIEGNDFTAIEGFPLMAVARLLRDRGYTIP